MVDRAAPRHRCEAQTVATRPWRGRASRTRPGHVRRPCETLPDDDRPARLLCERPARNAPLPRSHPARIVAVRATRTDTDTSAREHTAPRLRSSAMPAPPRADPRSRTRPRRRTEHRDLYLSVLRAQQSSRVVAVLWSASHFWIRNTGGGGPSHGLGRRPGARCTVRPVEVSTKRSGSAPIESVFNSTTLTPRTFAQRETAPPVSGSNPSWATRNLVSTYTTLRETLVVGLGIDTRGRSSTSRVKMIRPRSDTRDTPGSLSGL